MVYGVAAAMNYREITSITRHITVYAFIHVANCFLCSIHMLAKEMTEKKERVACAVFSHNRKPMYRI